MSRRIAVLACALSLGVFPLAAQESQEDPYFIEPSHSLGDQVLQIGIGPFVPLFLQSLTSVTRTGLTLGGSGCLQWNA